MEHPFERKELAVEITFAKSAGGRRRRGEARDDAGRLDAFRRVDLLQEVDLATAAQHLRRSELVREKRTDEERLAGLRRPKETEALLARPRAPELARSKLEIAQHESLIVGLGEARDRGLRLADRLLGWR